MPSKKRPKPLYQRGIYKLYAREDRANLEIVFYDDSLRRERSISAGTSDHAAGQAALDKIFLGSQQKLCKTCGRPFDGDGSPLLSQAITDYLLNSTHKAGYNATRGRLAHVITYVAETDPLVTCAQIDERWANAFRKWLAAKPIVETASGKMRHRSIGHIEGVVRQLIAAINATPHQQATFKAGAAAEVAQSPIHRADVKTLAAMFGYCLYPDARTPKEMEWRRKERENLLRYLRAAVATWARPEEIFDLGAGQWFKAAQVLNLNPPGRRQTKKYRTTIPVARQFAPELDRMGKHYMPVIHVRSTWAGMRKAIGLPTTRGESGEKLIRRSMATLVRRRIGEEKWRQGEMMLGHVKHSISDIYAVPDPANLGLALAETEAIIDEICALVPGSYRRFTADGSELTVLEGGLSG